MNPASKPTTSRFSRNNHPKPSTATAEYIISPQRSNVATASTKLCPCLACITIWDFRLWQYCQPGITASFPPVCPYIFNTPTLRPSSPVLPTLDHHQAIAAPNEGPKAMTLGLNTHSS
ncbi:hypothetical protein PtB15_12B457 [Puccinia triticina]|nr:hypothetical protein PtB15_12B457 [Puccinia triticina]